MMQLVPTQLAPTQLALPQLALTQLALPQLALPQLAATQLVVTQLAATQLAVTQLAATQLTATQMVAIANPAPMMMLTPMLLPGLQIKHKKSRISSMILLMNAILRQVFFLEKTWETASEQFCHSREMNFVKIFKVKLKISGILNQQEMKEKRSGRT